MSYQSTKFILGPVQRGPSLRSREIRADRGQAQQLGEIAAIPIRCLSCGHNWTSRRHGDGHFTSSLTHLEVSCPQCQSREEIPRHLVLESSG